MRLFEIHEQKWFPQFLRDEFVDGLQMILDVTNTYRPIANLLRQRLEQCGADRVLDLCSGAGGPWPSLVRDFESCGAKPPEVLLTDKYPCTARLDNRASASASRIHFLAHSVDATQIPEHLDGFRTLFSSFHHLKPDEARGLLRDSVSRGRGIAIFEAPARRAFTLLSLLFIPLAAWLFVPFRRPFRWSRLLLTYLVPLIPLVVLWDGLVSCFRTRTPEELLALSKSFPQYEWTAGYAKGGWLPPVYLIGRPERLKLGLVDSSTIKAAGKSSGEQH